MGFKTKLDYSDNRQIRQTEKTSTTLSGATVFGIPFSGLTTGPDLSATGDTSEFSLVISTFSGNNTTTNAKLMGKNNISRYHLKKIRYIQFRNIFRIEHCTQISKIAI